MSTAQPIVTWPQIPDAFVFPRSSKLPPQEAAQLAEIVENNRHLSLTLNEKRMVWGTLLGDGHITPTGMYVGTHSLSQKEYLWAKYMILQRFVLGVPSYYRRPKTGDESVRFWTAATSEFLHLRTQWYTGHGNQKKITTTLLDTIDEMGFIETIAWWLMDDGCRWGPPHSPTLAFCTHGFQFAGVELLKNWMTEHGYPAYVLTIRRDTDRGTYPMLTTSGQTAVRLMEDVAKFIHPYFIYKVTVTGRNDWEDCMFCGKRYRLAQLRRRPDLPNTWPCCENRECRLARKRSQNTLYMANPEMREAKYAQRREKYAVDEEYRRTTAKQNLEWQRRHPEKTKVYKERYREKQREEKATVMRPCRICGEKQQGLGKHERSDRMTCETCLPEWKRLLAKRRYYRKKAINGKTEKTRQTAAQWLREWDERFGNE